MKTGSTKSSRSRRPLKAQPIALTPHRVTGSADDGVSSGYVRNPRRVRRKRDARRWCDLLMVLAWNAPQSQLVPGDRLLTLEEQMSVSMRAEAWLAQSDPSLYDAVRWVDQNNARKRSTLALWRAGVARDAKRRRRLRARLRQSGFRIGAWSFSDILKFLSREVPGPTAEVAERQTR